MARTLNGPQLIQIGGFTVRLFGESAVTQVEPVDTVGGKRIVCHQVKNSVLSMIVIEYISHKTRVDVASQVDMFIDEYELEPDISHQFNLPDGVIEESIAFERFIGAAKNPSYCGLIELESDALVVLMMIRGDAVRSQEFYDELKASITISRAQLG
jgi:hypothetical protein